MALLLRSMAAKDIFVVALDISAAGAAGALGRMKALFDGWGTAWFDVARAPFPAAAAGFEGFAFARYSALWR